VIQAAKTVYTDYGEYHTSHDNKEFMSVSAVAESVESLILFLRAFELNRSVLLSQISGGEPMLGRRGLYPTLNSAQTRNMSSDLEEQDSRSSLNTLLEVVALIDGTRTIQEIVEFLDFSYAEVVPIVEVLIQQKLVSVA